jgi:hypothetical protein
MMTRSAATSPWPVWVAGPQPAEAAWQDRGKVPVKVDRQGS